MEIIAPIDTPFGEAAIARASSDTTLPITRIYLPGEAWDSSHHASALFFSAAKETQIAQQIRQFLSGIDVNFSPEELDMRGMSAFQRKVLSICWQIPRGKVSTYGGLSARLLVPKAARAVGTALARNPFPLVIPCHRVVRMDGDPGNFGGGRSMKKALLQMEGVRFDERGRVLKEFFW